MTKFAKISMILMMFIIFGFYSCQKEEFNNEVASSQELNLNPNSPLLKSTIPQKIWFYDLLVDEYGEEDALKIQEIISPQWNNSFLWNDNTIVIPCNHFVPLNYGYTRLFIQTLSDQSYQGYFYTVTPKNQEQIHYTQQDVEYFNGRLTTFDILLKDYIDLLEYRDGKPSKYYRNSNNAEDRCPDCWGGILSPEETDGTGSGGAGSDGWPDWWPDWGNNDNGGWDFPGNNGYDVEGAGGGLPIIGCHEPCPQGFSFEKCGHPRDCGSVNDDTIIITIGSDIPTPSRDIHNNGTSSNGNTGAGGGSNSGSNGHNGNASNNNPNNNTNPVDEAGLDEIKLQQLENKLCTYVHTHDTDYTCEELLEIVDVHCLDAPDFDECVQQEIDHFEHNNEESNNEYPDEDDACQEAVLNFIHDYNLSTSDLKPYGINLSECCGNDFENCANNLIFTTNGITDPNVITWLLNNPEFISTLDDQGEEQTNAGFLFNGDNISQLCENFFNLQITTNQNGSYAETGISGLNFSFDNPNGGNIPYSSNYVYLFMELDCNDPNTNYAQAFANAIQAAYNDVQTQINNGAITTQKQVGENFGIALKQNLWQFFQDCVPTNLSDAQSSTLPYLKNKIAGLGSHIEYTPINQQNIDELCP